MHMKVLMPIHFVLSSVALDAGTLSERTIFKFINISLAGPLLDRNELGQRDKDDVCS